uniref:Regulation of nuclear pre-mRNA domain containing 1B n=1 Tax=Taeniopygia guttata TaxID=59729 RepID=A0A674HN86_TAEGU
MSSFSESALEKKLSELSNSQQSVQTLSLWLIHHRKHAGPIVAVWHRELRKAKSSRKLTFLYLANDVIQNSKRKGPEFTREFESVLVDAFSHVAREADEGCKKPLERLLNIWQERSVYGSEFIQQLKLSMEDSNSPQTKVAEEKKSLKRTFQQIQEEEDDDYPGSYSPQDPSAGPLLTKRLRSGSRRPWTRRVCCWPSTTGGWRQSWRTGASWHGCSSSTPRTRRMFSRRRRRSWRNTNRSLLG